ncbi:hypothetical protein EV1_002292 [Malus domestica]
MRWLQILHHKQTHYPELGYCLVQFHLESSAMLFPGTGISGKVWRLQRQIQQSIHGTDSNAEAQIQEEEDAGYSRRTVDEETGSAFIP